MVTLHTLKAPHRSTHRKKRVGRGQGSGLGKTAGRGGKGQKARSGNMRFEGFEGGQSPLQPDQRHQVDETALRGAGLVKGKWPGIKVLGTGELSNKITVKVHKLSEGAREAITKAGGSIDEVPLMAHKPEAASKAHAGKGVKVPKVAKAAKA